MQKRIKRVLIGTGCLLLVAAIMFVLYEEQLKESYWRYQRKALLRSVDRYGPNLTTVDEIRLLRIDYASVGPGLGRFNREFLGPSERVIVADKTLHGPKALNLADRWRTLHFESNGALCYEPHHVIQFSKGGKMICESV